MRNTQVNKALSLLAGLAVSVMMVATAQAESTQEQAILERIKPVGEVCVEGTDCGGVATPVQAAGNAGGAKSGKDVYSASCSACHGAAAAALGAPAFGSASDWASRASKGMDALLNSAINGVNAMPPRGTCMSCSDDELAAAVEYMVSSSK